MITRPVRERPAAQVREMVQRGLEWSGHDEVALTSLSSADFSGIEGTVRDIVDDPEHGGRVSVSLPSLRVDAFTVGTAAEIQKVRRTGLTFAPEGGTWRMRTVINKLITEEDLYSAVDAAFSQGWRRVKLYFLIGLPTELDEDVLGIAELGARCVEIGRKYHKGVTVVASVGGFVPKPHTPFQWFGQDTVAELERKVVLLRDEARRTRGLTIRWHEPAASVAEGLASRGDRRMGAVIERVWRAGGTFQEWSERFDLSLWQAALAAEGLSVDEVCHRDRDERRGAALGPHLGGAAPGLPLGGLAGRVGQRGRRGLPLDAVLRLRRLHRLRRWSTSWPRRSRRRAGARARARTSASGTASLVRLVSRVSLRASAGSACASPRWGRSASPATATWPACGSGRCGAAGCRWPTPRGSSPHPLVSFGLALPTGCESRGEYLDLRLEPAGPGEIPVAELPAALSALLPEGIAVEAAALIGEAEGSLQQEVASCDWELEVLGVRDEELQERVAKMLAAPMLTVRRERKGRQIEDDIRPAIRTLSLTSHQRSSPGGTGHAPAWCPPRRPGSGPGRPCGARTGLSNASMDRTRWRSVRAAHCERARNRWRRDTAREEGFPSCPRRKSARARRVTPRSHRGAAAALALPTGRGAAPGRSRRSGTPGRHRLVPHPTAQGGGAGGAADSGPRPPRRRRARTEVVEPDGSARRRRRASVPAAGVAPRTGAQVQAGGPVPGLRPRAARHDPDRHARGALAGGALRLPVGRRHQPDRRQRLPGPGPERPARHGGRLHRHRHPQERRPLPG